MWVCVCFVRLLQMEVTSLADVYWFDDNVAARATFGKDLTRWLQARQTLPTSKENLEALKADLWSAVVKNSQHQDAWTWGMDSRRSCRIRVSPSISDETESHYSC